MTGFIRLNFTGKIGFNVHLNENIDNAVAICGFPLHEKNIKDAYHNCQLTEYYKIFSNMGKTLKFNKFVTVLLENHLTFEVDDEIEFPISLSFKFIFPYQQDVLFVSDNTKVFIKC